MKVIYPLLISVFLSTISCVKIDRSDLFSVIENVEKSFKRNDFNNIESLLLCEIDSMPREKKKEIQEISNIFKKGRIERIDVDTTLSPLLKYCIVSYLVDVDFYEVRFFYLRDSLNNIKIDDFSIFNIREECANTSKDEYCPKAAISFKGLRWSTSSSGKSIKSGAVEIQNNLDRLENQVADYSRYADFVYVFLDEIHHKKWWSKNVAELTCQRTACL